MTASVRVSAYRLLPLVGLLAALGGAVRTAAAQSPAVESCRQSVLQRLAPETPSVSLALGRQDAQGNATVTWSALSRVGGSNGLCVVDPAGRVIRLDVSSSTGPAGPQVQPPVTPATRVTCESVEARRKECPIPPDQQVRLARTLSVNPCTEGRTWGRADRIIWVTAGCRGEFEVSARPVAGPGFGAGAVRRLTCGSPTGQQIQCKTLGSAAQVRLVRDLSGGRCRQNATWGNTDSFIWANAGCRAEFEVTYQSPATPGPTTGLITCGTDGSGQAQCPLQGLAATIRLVRNLSVARCVEKSNWGFTSRFIWTNNGCRGEFEVTYRGPTPQPPRPQPPTPPVPSPRTLTCGNAAGASMSCNPIGTVSSVRLVRDLSGRCRQNSTWGFSQSDLWVRQGCYGQFEIAYQPPAVPVPR